MNKEIILVFGGESTGTRIVTECIIKTGYEGSSKHQQPLDDENVKYSEKMVYRRSFPHSSEWPDTDAIYERFSKLGYNIRVVITTRDWYCMWRSNERNERKHINEKNRIEVFNETYNRIFSFVNKYDLKYMVMSYEALVYYKHEYLRLMFEMFDLKNTDLSELNLMDGNSKWYRPDVPIKGEIC